MSSNASSHSSLALICGGIAFLLLSQSARAQFPAFTRSSFNPSGPQGFGDRQNSFAWSMEWFNGKLYVGTGRAEACVTAATAAVGGGTPQAYPPTDPAISCTPDYNDLPLQAEIWCWNPVTKVWTRVYQSPQDLAIPGANPAKYVARDIGFRGMLVYQEANGTNALYVGGCSSVEFHPGLPGGRMLRTTDGVNFEAVPAQSGTFLGGLTNACFRGMQTYNNKMYAMAVNWKGQGTILESANPSQGNNAFREVSAPAAPIYEIGVYNGFLWAGFVDNVNGFSVAKTNATGTPPYTFQTVIAKGGYRSPFPNPIAISMQVFNNRLYVGADDPPIMQAQGAELFRINPDDSWDLVAGSARDTTPDGPKAPISSLGPGFGWALNDTMWRMEVYGNTLYVGTFDNSTNFRSSAQLASYVAPELGFDLWCTTDGADFTLIDQTGFEDPFAFGARTMKSTPYGMFLGTANPYYGLQVYEAIPALSNGLMLGAAGHVSYNTTPDPPLRLQAEGGAAGVLLSWNAPARGAKTYHILRWSYSSQTSPLESPIVYQEIATTNNTYYNDTSASPSLNYAYEVKADNGTGQLSGPSNYATYPPAALPVTVQAVWDLLTQVQISGQVTVQTLVQLLGLWNQAQQDLQQGNFLALIRLYGEIVNNQIPGLPPFIGQDLQTLVGRLLNRTQLVQAGLLALNRLF